MNIAYRTLFAGMLAIVFSATAVAHERHGSDWSGGLTVAVTPGGQVALGGTLGYGPVYAVPAQRVAYVERGYRPVCSHPSHRHYRGHRGHWKKHHRHHRRHGRH